MTLRSSSGLALLAGALAAAASLATAAELRGVPLKVRADESREAAVVEEIQLYADSHALVIGIDDYNNGWPRLSMAVKDARLIAEVLEKKGFDVELVLNPDAETLNRTFERFFVLKGEKPDARLFVWYAGHGHTERGEGFLVPADAPRPEVKGQFRLKALALRRIGEYVRMAESKHAFAVFDSCFSGTVFESARALPPAAVTRATTLPVRQFLTSGDAGQTVSDNGTFRELFLRALAGEERADANDDGYLTASELGMFLTDRITNLTQSKQTPRYGKLRDKDWDRGDFVFATPKAAAPTPVAAVAQGGEPSTAAARMQQETAFWETIKDGDDAAAFAAYLQQYPDGAFARLAQVKLDAARAGTSRQRGELDAERKRLEAERARFAADAERIREEQAGKLMAQMDAERQKIEAARAALARQQQLALATQSGQGRQQGSGQVTDVLSGDQVKLLLANNSGNFLSPKTGAKISVKFGADGSMQGTAPNGSGDTGTWWVENDRFCRKWEKFAKGETGCFELRLAGRSLEHYLRNGRLMLTVELDDIPATFATARRQ